MNMVFLKCFSMLTHVIILLKKFTSIFKSRVIDCFKQEWFGSIDRNRVLDEYKMFKVNFIYEEYLDSVPHNLCFITRLRISAHSLRIHIGRFGVNRLPRHERLCLNCNLQDVEDVYNFVCICPKYRTIRLKYTSTAIIMLDLRYIMFMIC